MAEIKLFIATSIDGFIARENGSLDWLPGSDPNASKSEAIDPELGDGGYGKFIADIDTVIMGRKTYEEILGFGVEWPYADYKSYIVTSDKNYQTKTDNTVVLNEINKQSIVNVKSESKKGVWVVGGGQLITHFINHDAVDEMNLSIISTILGKGIRLFPNDPKETKFVLTKSETFGDGMVNLSYRKK